MAWNRATRIGVGMKAVRANEVVAACAECGKPIKRKDYGHSQARGAQGRRMLCPKCVKGKKGRLSRLFG